MNAGSELVEQQGVAYARTVAEAMNLKLDAAIQQTARNCAEQFSILSPGKKCESRKALPSVVDCYFHHRMNLPCSAAGKMASPV
jgi:hypothetical protein